MTAEKDAIPSADAPAVLGLLPPFPIVLVTTRTNVLTIGQLHCFTFSPLRIGIAVARSRFTHALLSAEREFVVNIPDATLLDAVKVCGAVSGKDRDKFAAAGLTREPSAAVRAVSLLECGAQIECRVEREMEFEDRTWFIGAVAAARRRANHQGMESLLCGRNAYVLPGTPVAPR